MNKSIVTKNIDYSMSDHVHYSTRTIARILGIDFLDMPSQGWSGSWDDIAVYVGRDVHEVMNAVGCSECQDRYSTGEIDVFSVMAS